MQCSSSNDLNITVLIATSRSEVQLRNTQCCLSFFRFHLHKEVSRTCGRSAARRVSYLSLEIPNNGFPPDVASKICKACLKESAGIRPSAGPSVGLSACILSFFLYVCLPVCLSFYMSVCLSFFLSFYMSACLSVCLPFFLCLSLFLSICVCLSFFLTKCLSFLLYMCLSFFLTKYLSFFL